MPVDQHEDEDDKDAGTGQRVYKEFDCPSCNANNPCDAPLAEEDEIRCNYCGDEFKVHFTDEGRMKLKEA